MAVSGSYCASKPHKIHGVGLVGEYTKAFTPSTNVITLIVKDGSGHSIFGHGTTWFLQRKIGGKWVNTVNNSAWVNEGDTKHFHFTGVKPNSTYRFGIWGTSPIGCSQGTYTIHGYRTGISYNAYSQWTPILCCREESLVCTSIESRLT